MSSRGWRSLAWTAGALLAVSLLLAAAPVVMYRPENSRSLRSAGREVPSWVGVCVDQLALPALCLTPVLALGLVGALAAGQGHRHDG